MFFLFSCKLFLVSIVSCIISLFLYDWRVSVFLLLSGLDEIEIGSPGRTPHPREVGISQNWMKINVPFCFSRYSEQFTFSHLLGVWGKPLRYTILTQSVLYTRCQLHHWFYYFRKLGKRRKNFRGKNVVMVKVIVTNLRSFSSWPCLTQCIAMKDLVFLCLGLGHLNEDNHGRQLNAFWIFCF